MATYLEWPWLLSQDPSHLMQRPLSVLPHPDCLGRDMRRPLGAILWLPEQGLGRDMALPLSLLGRHTLAAFLLPPTLWPVLFFSTVVCQMQRCPSLGKECRQSRTLFCKTTATKNTFFSFPVVQANLNHHYFTQMCTLQALCACPSSRRTRTGGQPSRLSRYAAWGANLDLPSGPENLWSFPLAEDDVPEKFAFWTADLPPILLYFCLLHRSY